MAVQSVEPSLQGGVVEKLREMATNRVSIESMVEFVRASLGNSEVWIVPAMAYFCRAFSLPLREVLPLREWVESHDDESIATLLARIESFRVNPVPVQNK